MKQFRIEETMKRTNCSHFLLLFFIVLHSIDICRAYISGKAAFTYYNSYPFCCPSSPNYNPSAPTQECVKYSGCSYLGDFAAFINDTNPQGHRSLDYVENHNLIAFYDNSDPKGTSWASKYAGKTILLTKTYNKVTFSFNATIADTCANSDCNGCCAQNTVDAGATYLVDMEYYTVMANFGTVGAVDGTIDFEIYDSVDSSVANAAPCVGKEVVYYWTVSVLVVTTLLFLNKL